jgi:hypothetical protein
MHKVLPLLLLSSLAVAAEPMRMEPTLGPAPRAAVPAGALEEVSADIARIQAGLAQAGNALAQGGNLYRRYDEQLGQYLKLAADVAAGNQAALGRFAQATHQMQETRMSFNQQYLALQTGMQNENRQYTMISNVMKTKHDTVKNSISNVR